MKRERKKEAVAGRIERTFQHNAEGTSKPASSLPMTETQRF